MTTTIRVGPSATPRSNFVADSLLPAGADIAGAWEMVDAADGAATPAQLDAVTGVPRVAWYVASLAAGQERTYELRPASQAQDAKRGIALDDQSENGRVVVYYGGLLQTIYHYGMPNYRPRFAPNVAPSGRPNSGVSSTDGSQPKSITDDGPPDHTWHRSLWYACGDLNGVDFYLEPAAMNMGYGPHVGTGYGRIVHRSFDWIESGPVWGGFQQRAQWVTPDGRVLLDDVRRFRMFRLKGRQRIWDIEADFTPPAEPVTFGQTNENALPLMRVADIIDEWDGGTMSLSTGLTGSPNCFGQRAEWADCSGPFTRAIGQEPEIFGIAMLDHPSNRNHPNAWFVRGYGPVGTNLPFFDGALTLAPGETWSLRHRMFIHQGCADEGGVAARFDEYARPVSASAQLRSSEATMTNTDEKYIIRKLSETPEERGVCGWRKTLVTHDDTPVANVSHLRIDDSKKHYHREMTEFYYVLSGGGTIWLDGDTREITAGDMVVIKPGTWHTSDGEMDVLILGVPAGEKTDIWFE